LQDAFVRRLTQVLRSPVAAATQRLQAAVRNLHQLQRLLAPFGPPHAPPEQQLLSEIDVALLGDLLHRLSEKLLQSQQPQQQEQQPQQQQQQQQGDIQDQEQKQEQGQSSEDEQHQQMEMQQPAPEVQLEQQQQQEPEPSGGLPGSSAAPHMNGQHLVPGEEPITMDMDD
jgi:hypothetical protein